MKNMVISIYMLKHTTINRLIIGLLIQAFLLSILPVDMASRAHAASVSVEDIMANPDAVAIPKELGLIKSKFAGNAGKLIIHIQDAHCNFEAQSNIVSMLEGMIKNYGLSLISVEGADGLIDTSWFKAFPDEEIRKEVAAYFMKKGEITGPEYLSITSNYPIKLFGAETKEYYIQNLNAFTTSFPYRDEMEKHYTRIKTALNNLKNVIYSDDLKDMDVSLQEYESKRIKFNDYVRFLQETAEKNKVNLREFENFFRLVSVLVYEKKIDFNVTDKERNTLIDEISKSMEKDEMTSLVNQSMSFKMDKISSADYYNYLKALAIKKGIDIQARFPNLYNYIIYNSIYSKIDNEKLFHDIKKIEDAVKEKMFKNDDQRALDKLSRHVEMMIGLVNIKLLNGDYEYYKLHKDEFSFEKFSDFIKNKSAQHGLPYDIIPPSENVTKSVPRLEEFYEIAIKRDKALVGNTLAEMDNQKQRIAVLVTGGFHSEGMARILEKQGISYVVVCPSITKDVPTPYLKILMNQRTSFDDILVDSVAPVKEGMLAAPLMTRLAALSDDEIRALFYTASADEEELKELLSGILLRAANFRDGWERARVTRRLADVIRLTAATQYGRDLDTMREAYIAAVKDRMRKDAVETKGQGVLTDAEKASIDSFVDRLTSAPEFNRIFQAVHSRMAGMPVIAGVASHMSLQDAQAIIDGLSENDSRVHFAAQIAASSVIGEHARKLAEARAREGNEYEAQCNIILVNEMPVGRLSRTNRLLKGRMDALKDVCKTYYKTKGYTVHVVDDYNAALNLITEHPDWTTRNTITGFVDKVDLEKMGEALKQRGLDGRSRLLAMAASANAADNQNDSQYIPVKGFIDLMAAIVRIRGPLKRGIGNDAAILDGIEELLKSIGADRPKELADVLTDQKFYDDPIKAADLFIIRLLPRAKPFDSRELRSRIDAALIAVRSL